jgi:hypothetical protein
MPVGLVKDSSETNEGALLDCAWFSSATFSFSAGEVDIVKVLVKVLVVMKR